VAVAIAAVRIMTRQPRRWGKFPSGAEDVWTMTGDVANCADVQMPRPEPANTPPITAKPFPVILPGTQEVTRGAMWRGGPFLGALGSIRRAKRLQ